MSLLKLGDTFYILALYLTGGDLLALARTGKEVSAFCLRLLYRRIVLSEFRQYFHFYQHLVMRHCAKLQQNLESTHSLSLRFAFLKVSEYGGARAEVRELVMGDLLPQIMRTTKNLRYLEISFPKYKLNLPWGELKSLCPMLTGIELNDYVEGNSNDGSGDDFRKYLSQHHGLTRLGILGKNHKLSAQDWVVLQTNHASSLRELSLGITERFDCRVPACELLRKCNGLKSLEIFCPSVASSGEATTFQADITKILKDGLMGLQQLSLHGFQGMELTMLKDKNNLRYLVLDNTWYLNVVDLEDTARNCKVLHTLMVNAPANSRSDAEWICRVWNTCPHLHKLVVKQFTGPHRELKALGATITYGKVQLQR